MHITMIGHSCVLIETGELRILTDPFFATAGTALSIRTAPPAYDRTELANVNLVLISHTHFDHIDGSFLRLLPITTPVLVPAASRQKVINLGGQQVVGVEPGQDLAKVHVVHASHFGPAVGYVIRSEGINIYFAGDTFCRNFMVEIAAQFPLRAALIPVFTFRLPMTMNEQEAVRALGMLKPQTVIPIHLDLQARPGWLRTGGSAESFRQMLRQSDLDCELVTLRGADSWVA
jgi:L-ascorbate metabolism protein UlaG (beta-lactamase superfamily)